MIVDGLDVRQAPIYEVAEVVGLVQQNPEAQFCTLTVQDEVAFGLENRCLPGRRSSRGWIGRWTLSARRTCAIASWRRWGAAAGCRGLHVAGRPKVLIFDEPTSNLDPAATAVIFDVIARVARTAALTVIVIEHKTDYLRRFSPRWIRVEEGRVTEAESPRRRCGRGYGARGRGPWDGSPAMMWWRGFTGYPSAMATAWSFRIWISRSARVSSWW